MSIKKNLDKLSPLAFKVTQEEATERAFTSPLNNENRAGTFKCIVCETPLFKSDAKFDAGCGWPSFFEPLPGIIGEKTDVKLGYERTEVHCENCGAHLGHVFPDGPPPTGLRYCINGVSLEFNTKG